MPEGLNTNEIDPKTIFKCDAQGNLLPEGNISNIETRYQELIDEIKEKFIKLIGAQNIVSIYVSGSIARGATGANSDMDMFVVVGENINIDEQKAKSLQQQTRREVRKKELVSKIDVGFVSISELIGENTSFGRQFITKLLSACVYGEDLSSKLPNFKADEETARKRSMDVQTLVDKARRILKERERSANTKKTCRWIMKIILINSFYLVLGREKKYTNSPETMAKLFKNHFPQKSKIIEQVLNLFNNPTDDKSEIEEVLNDFTPWLAEQVEILKNQN
jgi:predicted nucleotidyltransferase